MFFPRNLTPALQSCRSCVFHGFCVCNIFVLSFTFLKQFSTWFLTKYTRVCAHPSVYNALKYSTETVTPRTFSKIVMSHSFLSYSSFCVNIFSKNFLLFMLAFGHVTVKNVIEHQKFSMFLKLTYLIFFFFKIVLFKMNSCF